MKYILNVWMIILSWIDMINKKTNPTNRSGIADVFIFNRIKIVIKKIPIFLHQITMII